MVRFLHINLKEATAIIYDAALIGPYTDDTPGRNEFDARLNGAIQAYESQGLDTEVQFQMSVAGDRYAAKVRLSALVIARRQSVHP